MKRIFYFVLLAVASSLVTSCVKDEPVGGEPRTYSNFIIEAPKLSASNLGKSFVDYDYHATIDSLTRILYEDGDALYVNGKRFSIEYDGTRWCAYGDTVHDRNGSFYCCHANGAVSNFSAPTYRVSFNDNLTATSGIVLVGTTAPSSNVVTFSPSFAVLLFKPSNIDPYTGVKVGFEGGKVPYVFTISASNGAISNPSFLAQASSSNSSYTMLSMKRQSNYYYICVPFNGSSLTTKLYVQYERSDETAPIQRVTSNQITLEKGKVYIMPSEEMTDYPFDENGEGKGVFSVSSTQTVRFSPGNLQVIPFAGMREWRFANHQYDVITSSENQSIGVNYRSYIDLMGYGTTGLRINSTYLKYQPYETVEASSTNTYCPYNLTGRADWGYFQINYGARPSESSWRTLSKDEWQYLLNTRANATARKGRATVNGVKGFVLLPDSWNLPSGVTFTANTTGYTSNVYTTQQWSKMEGAGAIFLPVNGKRTVTTVSNNETDGYYWTSTVSLTDHQSYCFHFSGNVATATLSHNRGIGCSVRLVCDAN